MESTHLARETRGCSFARMTICQCWVITLAAMVTSSGCTSPGRPELPASCSTVTWPTAGQAPGYPRPWPGKSPVLDTLLAWLRDQAYNGHGKPYSSILARRDSLWKVDSIAVGIALSEIILGGTGSESITATYWYAEVSGRSEPVLGIFIKYAEPMERVPWVLSALKPPLDSVSQRQVFGYACDAAWKLLQLKQDPFIASRAESGHGVFRVTSLQGILLSARDLVDGPLHPDFVRLVHAAGEDSLLK